MSEFTGVDEIEMTQVDMGEDDGNQNVFGSADMSKITQPTQFVGMDQPNQMFGNADMSGMTQQPTQPSQMFGNADMSGMIDDGKSTDSEGTTTSSDDDSDEEELESVEEEKKVSKYEKKKYSDLFEMGLWESFLYGFRYESESLVFFLENKLYKTVTLETILYYAIVIPWVCLQLTAIVFFCLYAAWDYLPAFGGPLQILAFLCFCLILCLCPVFSDSYFRVSEKTEKVLNGEDPGLEGSGWRLNGSCLYYNLVYSVTTTFECLIYVPFVTILALSFLIVPCLYPILLIIGWFERTWSSFKIVLIRKKKGILGYFYLPLFFIRNLRAAPVLYGIGAGYSCRRRGIGSLFQNYFSTVSATRFYWEYLDDDEVGKVDDVPPNPGFEGAVMEGDEATATTAIDAASPVSSPMEID